MIQAFLCLRIKKRREEGINKDLLAVMGTLWLMPPMSCVLTKGFWKSDLNHGSFHTKNGQQNRAYVLFLGVSHTFSFKYKQYFKQSRISGSQIGKLSVVE